MLLEKQVTSTRWRLWASRRSNAAPTLRSPAVKPGRSALVESEKSASTPRLPSSPKRARSVPAPSGGLGSSLKSAVCSTVPTGVCSTISDCNENGTPDACDITDGISVDCNENGVPDECDGGCS